MNGGNVLLSGTQDRLLFVSLLLGVPCVSPCLHFMCLFSLLACLFRACASLMALSFSVAFLKVSVFPVCLYFGVFSFFHRAALFCCCFSILLVIYKGPFFLSFMLRTPFLHVRAARRCIESGTTYRQVVDHQLHTVLPAHLDWNRCQCSFGVTSSAALRAAARRT